MSNSGALGRSRVSDASEYVFTPHLLLKNPQLATTDGNLEVTKVKAITRTRNSDSH